MYIFQILGMPVTRVGMQSCYRHPNELFTPYFDKTCLQQVSKPVVWYILTSSAEPSKANWNWSIMWQNAGIWLNFNEIWSLLLRTPTRQVILKILKFRKFDQKKERLSDERLRDSTGPYSMVFWKLTFLRFKFKKFDPKMNTGTWTTLLLVSVP